MNFTVFLTVISGVITYVLGQLVLRLVIEPVQEMKQFIGQIAHSLTEYANVIHNPGVPSDEVMNATSEHLRKLSAQLEAQLYLVPMYKLTAFLFRLPSWDSVLSGSQSLMGLSNSVYRASDGVYEANAKRVENICDSLGIYLAKGNRWPREST